MTTKTAGTLKTEAEEDYSALKDDIATLRADLKGVIDDIKGIASVRARSGMEKGKKVADKAGEQLSETRADVESQIRSNPLAAVGIAFGAGLMLALMRGK